MREIEVWFCRHDGVLYYASNYVGKEPRSTRVAGSVAETLRRLGLRYDIVSVGIIPPDALGLV